MWFLPYNIGSCWKGLQISFHACHVSCGPVIFKIFPLLGEFHHFFVTSKYLLSFEHLTCRRAVVSWQRAGVTFFSYCFPTIHWRNKPWLDNRHDREMCLACFWVFTKQWRKHCEMLWHFTPASEVPVSIISAWSHSQDTKPRVLPRIAREPTYFQANNPILHYFMSDSNLFLLSDGRGRPAGAEHCKPYLLLSYTQEYK
jgi:hypothetical protein